MHQGGRGGVGIVSVMVNVVDAFKGDGYMSTRLAEFQPNVVILYDAPTILPIRVAERYTSHMKGRGGERVDGW